MQDSIFTDKFPLVTSDRELNRVKALYPNYDSYYVASGCIQSRKEKFDRMWKAFRPLADKNFLSDIKKHFHQRTWEMYLGCVFLEAKLDISSSDDSPDFIVDKGKETEIFIEATACERGNTKNAVPEMFIAEKLEEIIVQDVPVDKMILRITQAIKTKADQYKRWELKNWFNQSTPFIIALNTADLDYPEDPNMPNVIKALFGFQFMRINLKNRETSYSHRNEIQKSNNQFVSVDYFASDNFSFMSGILFSGKRVLNHPSQVGDDCILVNNPFSKHSVNENFVKLFKTWYAEKTNGEITLQKNY